MTKTFKGTNLESTHDLFCFVFDFLGRGVFWSVSGREGQDGRHLIGNRISFYFIRLFMNHFHCFCPYYSDNQATWTDDSLFCVLSFLQLLWILVQNPVDLHKVTPWSEQRHRVHILSSLVHRHQIKIYPSLFAAKRSSSASHRIEKQPHQRILSADSSKSDSFIHQCRRNLFRCYASR